MCIKFSYFENVSKNIRNFNMDKCHEVIRVYLPLHTVLINPKMHGGRALYAPPSALVLALSSKIF